MSDLAAIRVEQPTQENILQMSGQQIATVAILAVASAVVLALAIREFRTQRGQVPSLEPARVQRFLAAEQRAEIAKLATELKQRMPRSVKWNETTWRTWLSRNELRRYTANPNFKAPAVSLDPKSLNALGKSCALGACDLKELLDKQVAQQQLYLTELTSQVSLEYLEQAIQELMQQSEGIRFHLWHRPLVQIPVQAAASAA